MGAIVRARCARAFVSRPALPYGSAVPGELVTWFEVLVKNTDGVHRPGTVREFEGAFWVGTPARQLDGDFRVVK